VQHAAALALASQSGDRYEQARALDGLARSYHAAGDPGRADRHWRRALARYTDLGLLEADDVRGRLTALAGAAFHAVGEAGLTGPDGSRARTG
jgi:hypothetical protein